MRYAALGDSFSAGTEPGVEGFPGLVAARLAGDYLNVARDGARCADVLAEQVEQALAFDPELVTVICGANDVVRTTRPDVSEFGTAFDSILEAFAGRRVVTATYPAVAELLPLRDRTRERVRAGLDEVNGEIRRLSQRHGAACLELAGHPGSADPENFAADGFHPSARGHRHAAEALYELLREEEVAA